MELRDGKRFEIHGICGCAVGNSTTSNERNQLEGFEEGVGGIRGLQVVNYPGLSKFGGFLRARRVRMPPASPRESAMATSRRAGGVGRSSSEPPLPHDLAVGRGRNSGVGVGGVSGGSANKISSISPWSFVPPVGGGENRNVPPGPLELRLEG